MANHVSALKRSIQNAKRRARNRAGKSANRAAIKKFLAAVQAGEGTTALPAVASQLASSAAKGIIPKKRASRKISRLAKAANAAK